VRRILDTYPTIELYITGSSSTLSSKQIATELRGRTLETYIEPLSFREFLRFTEQNIDWEIIDAVDSVKAQFFFIFDQYLRFGSLPEIVLAPDDRRIELIQGYFQTVVQKDICERYQIERDDVIKTILKLLINAQMITVSKLYNTLKSMGIAIGKTTLNEYLSHIEDSYFITLQHFFSPSMVNQLQYPRKVHCVDNGFYTALSTKFSFNHGRLFESTVYRLLKARHEDVFYFRDEKDREIDCVIVEQGQVRALYQVCYELSDVETQVREFKSLERTAKKFQCDTMGVISRDRTVILSAEHAHISVIPIWELF